MEAIWQGVHAEFSDVSRIVAVTQCMLRLLLATLLGGLLGAQQKRQSTAAGLRTYMLVALGSALFVLIPLQAGLSLIDVSRVLHGLTVGIGVLGAGTLLKQYAPGQMHSLTTAAGLWLTAAVGVAVGLGRNASAVLGTCLACLILALLPPGESPPAARERPWEDPDTRPHDTWW
jgi:putative Mg2+ transporter-C (MgtC) family protein